jgi:zinc transporter
MPISVFDIAPDGSARPADGPVPDTGYRWYHFDLTDPDLPAWLATQVPAIPAAALMAPETRPRCDSYADGLMLNLRGVNLNEDGPADQMVAVRMWVTAQMVVTVRVRRVFAINAMRKDAETGHAPPTPMDFVAAVADRLMVRVQDTVFDLCDRVDRMEDSVQDDTAPLPPDLAEERRMAIRLRRYLGPQRDALVALVGTNSPLMTQPLRDRLREQANLAKLTVEELDGLNSRMMTVQDHYSARTAQLQAHNGYLLSIVAAVFLPLGFITGLFGVNVGGMPGVESEWAFAILCLAMIALMVGVIWVLRRMRWL